MIKAEKKSAFMPQQLTSKTVALILAGGRGTRLKDLTIKRTKPAVHFGGKFRIIDFTLSNCINSGIRRVGVITQYQSHSLIKHIQRGWSFFSSEMNEFVELLPAQQSKNRDEWYRGTADSVAQNIEIIKRYKAEYILILAGDHIYKQDYAQMLTEHVHNGAKCTVACIPVPVEEASSFGIMEIDDTNKIISFIEKPEIPSVIGSDINHSLASMGIYIFNSEYLFELLEKDEHNTQSSHDFGKDIIPEVVNAGEAYAHHFNSSCIQSQSSVNPYWKDVGTLYAYWKANIDLTSASPALNIYDANWPIHTHACPQPPAKFLRDATGNPGEIKESLISGGSVIQGSTISHSILFSRVKVSFSCLIDSSVIFSDVIIGHSCRLHRCIIERGCTIPDGTIIGENKEEDANRFYCSEEGIVLVTREMLNALSST